MTHTFERILLATEHTEFDSGAEHVAFAMAQRCKVPLAAVIPVLSNPEYETVAPQLAKHAEQEAAAKIANLRTAAASNSVQLDIAARRGAEPYREIVQEAVRQNADLIVIRRRGKRSFLPSLLVGEMVSKVVAHAPCNVLLVPRAGKMWAHRILAAVDTSPNAAHVAHIAARIAKQCSLPLTLVSVAAHEAMRTAAESTLAHAVAVASGTGVTAESRVLLGKPFEQILGMAKSQGADLIVVGRHGESNLIQMPFGSTTQKVIGLASGPVLVVRAPNPGGPTK